MTGASEYTRLAGVDPNLNPRTHTADTASVDTTDQPGGWRKQQTPIAPDISIVSGHTYWIKQEIVLRSITIYKFLGLSKEGRLYTSR